MTLGSNINCFVLAEFFCQIERGGNEFLISYYKVI